MPGEFDDYINQPKANDYKSLHTAVIGPEDKVVEVQIRTFEMHEHAEFGVAAHWRYKEGGKGDSAYEEKIAWLRQLLDWREEVSDRTGLADAFQTELFADTDIIICAATPVSATPIGAETFELNGVQVASRPSMGLLTQPISFIGLPVVTVPVFQAGKMPLGVQVIAAPWREAEALRVAAELERRGVVKSPIAPL